MIVKSRFLLVLALQLFLQSSGDAMKPFVPDTASYDAAHKQATLTIKRDGWKAKLSDKATGKTFPWTDEIYYPSRAVLAPKQRKVILLGGLGDAGSDLGSILVYSFEGKKLAALNVKQVVPNLEALSQAFTEEMGPFQWLGDVALREAEGELRIAVCKKVQVTLNLDALTLRAAQ